MEVGGGGGVQLEFQNVCLDDFFFKERERKKECKNTP